MRDGCFNEYGRPVPCPGPSHVASPPVGIGWKDCALLLIALVFLSVGGVMLYTVADDASPAAPPPPPPATVVVIASLPTLPPATPRVQEVYVITPTPAPSPTKSPERIRIDAQKTAAALARITPTPAPCPTNAAALTQGAVCQWAMPTPTMAPTWTPSPRCLTPIPGAVCQPGGTWLGQPEPPTPIGGEQ